MTKAMFAICEKLDKLSDDDLIILSDEAVAERKRRGLYPRKTYAPGYCNSYQKVQRDLRKKRNGRNTELREYRKRNKLTQAELAAKLGTIGARICDYETGAMKTPQYIMDYIRKGDSYGTL